MQVQLKAIAVASHPSVPGGRISCGQPGGIFKAINADYHYS